MNGSLCNINVVCEVLRLNSVPFAHGFWGGLCTVCRLPGLDDIEELDTSAFSRGIRGSNRLEHNFIGLTFCWR